ncbi:MAG: ABC transporter permease, partial [Sphingomonas bacterium]
MNDWRMAWRLARRELDLKFRGLRLLLACLFLGVGALAAIGSLTQAIQRELASRGAMVLGGDLEFAVSQRPAAPGERAVMTSLGTVSETMRMQGTAVGGTPATPLIVPIELKGIDSAYPLYGSLKLADGRVVHAPDPTTAWIAPALAERLGVHPGNQFRLGSAMFRVGGVIA